MLWHNSEATRNLYGQKVDQLNIRFSKQIHRQSYPRIQPYILYIGWAEVDFPRESPNWVFIFSEAVAT